MRFPIDMSWLRCDDDGEVLWRVPVVALGDEASDVLRGTVAGDSALEPGATVALEEMTALTWRLDGRSGVSLRALVIATRADLGVVKAG
jgi:hypothetical protein